MTLYSGFYGNPNNNFQVNYPNVFSYPNVPNSMSAQVAKDQALWTNLGWNGYMQHWAQNVDARQNGVALYGPYGYPVANNSGVDRQSWLSAFFGGSHLVGDQRADQAAAMGNLFSVLMTFLA